MIEMHQDGESLGAGAASEDAFYFRRGPGLIRLALSAPAMAIASLVVALVSLASFSSGNLAGETAVLSSNSRQISQITEVRAEAWVQWAGALVALALAIAAAVRLRSARMEILDDEVSFDDSGATAEADLQDDVSDDDLTDADLDVVLDLEERKAALDPPQWLQALVGAALIVAVVATAFATFALIYALQAHVNSRFF